MGKKSLAEQIAELSAPKNDFDIENSELADPFGNSENENDSLGLDNEAAQREHYVKVPKSKIRREDGLIKDKKYTGQVTNRKALYEESESGESGLEDGSDGGLQLEKRNQSDSESPNSESENDSGEETGSSSENELDAGSDNRQREKIKQMMASERKHIVSRLSQSAAADALKGYSILQQHKEFDALIDSRLKVQKALTSLNMLPATQKQFEEVCDNTEDTGEKIQLATAACYDLLDTIGALRDALLEREQLPTQKPAKKRTLQEYLARSTQQDAVLLQYRSQVLTKWLAKIQNSSGSSAMNASKFKALNQSAEQQVANNLADMDRLVKRTRLNRRKITPLGFTADDTNTENVNGNGNIDADEMADVPAQTRSLNMQEIPQIFDDEDFYRVLLNDLVDKKIQLSDPTLGLQFALRGAASTKLKKNVDNKASKGRKLRFHVQEPIANFDTPRQWVQWNDDQIDEFFASLLGQKISMKENDDSEPEAEEEEEEVLGEDSIQLFG
ncbi:hypothetical protein HF325_001319 [Metschnikowia pulcherrima]|uniref:Protein BFR2 n=1 Tax=Metschnikowia pulcherrima TaxID=27326 RepID=A0A8H7GWH3_9ASCO|nr:hypothetical protein HF325_001319 [Metschnikowia pulcherrima]